LPDFSAERQRFGNLSRLTITWDHLSSLLAAQAIARRSPFQNGTSHLAGETTGLYLMFWITLCTYRLAQIVVKNDAGHDTIELGGILEESLAPAMKARRGQLRLVAVPQEIG
jgi:hypothetical protein